MKQLKKILSVSGLLVFLLVSTTFLSCSKKGIPPGMADNTDVPNNPDDQDDIDDAALFLKLVEESVTVKAGSEIEVKAQSNIKLADRSFDWSLSDPALASLNKINDTLVKIKGLKIGETTIKVRSQSKNLESTSTIVINFRQEGDKDVIKILAIGNSFSDDALESYLYGLADAGGFRTVIGNLYIGGSGLALHANNIKNNSKSYSYRKITSAGRSVQDGKSIEDGLLDEDWDYISFQQQSDFSGMFNTFDGPLQEIYNYVKEKSINPNVKYVLHQTWAYAQNSTHPAFPNYNSNQMQMYEAIVDAYKQAKNLINADIIVPAGTAIQNGRTSFIGDNFNRDGFHLDLNIGRYTASCTWYEAIFGKNVVGNTYKPSALNATETEIAQYAAHYAVSDPFEVTVLTDYGINPVEMSDSPIQINFGTKSGVPEEWNSIVPVTVGTSIPYLKDANGTYTTASFTVTEEFNNINNDGSLNTTTALNLPSSVSNDSYFGNPKGVFGSKLVEKSAFKIEGLNSNKLYNFCFFASRMNVGDNREAKYTVSGSNAVVVYLNAANNTSNIACAENVKPASDGSILVEVTAGPNNTNSLGFYYLGATVISLVP